MEAKEEVRARLNIEDVIGEYVDLKRAGRNFKGLSPFSGEKTPSFFVSPEKQIWHDFSSNRGGDVFSFVMEAEGMDFRQALEHLARKAGVDLSMYESKQSQGIAKKKRRLREANALAAHFFQHNLLKNQHALEYVFKKRQLSKDVVGEFQIGYAPDAGNALVEYLTKKGFSKQELGEAGLTNRFGGDLFRGRMTVPLMDASGEVIGFTGRIIGDVENAPKYLNTPQTLIYDKGRHVFGLSQAKEAIRKSDFAVIVEGNLDVVSSHQADVRQVVATAGTAMTEYHLKALKRLTSDIRLAFDGDKAGIAATERAISIAANLDITLSIIQMADGAKDPDELCKQDVKLWERAIAMTVPAVDWILDQYAKRFDITSANGKRHFTTMALELIVKLSDPVVREHYETIVAQKLGSSLEAIRAKASTQKPEKPRQKTAQPREKIDEDAYVYEDDLLATASLDVESRELFADFDGAMLHGELRQLFAKTLAQQQSGALDIPEQLQSSALYGKIIARADTRYAAWSQQDRYFETARLIRKVKNETRKQKKATLLEQLRDAELTQNDELAQALRDEVNTLIKEIARG